MKHVDIVTNFLELCRENRDWLRKICIVLIILILVAVMTGSCYRIYQQSLPAEFDAVEIKAVESIEEVSSENIEPETIAESIDIDIDILNPEPEITEEISYETPSPDPEPIQVETEPIEVPSEPPSEPETAESIPEVDEYAVELLACAIYVEVGADYCCDECRRRVCDVILNRVESDLFPNTIYEVLTQPGQYSAFGNGVYWPYQAEEPGNAEAVERAYRIAREVLEGNHSELYGNGYIWQAGFVQGSEGFYCCDVYYGKN